ncbi:hypothetical protein GCM10010508_42670 [Streptomyces naganishii JCM 4654]|uniref:Uncharacterized protein n=1 Tax=Streptomyces naganishii JCM 4654 TaxID=1306179 RepID=A0A918Y5J6_9ACTN|nr:hypothetical protein GCM10010508_42670 [Streptomyces naganishii JCM 4654]
MAWPPRGVKEPFVRDSLSRQRPRRNKGSQHSTHPDTACADAAWADAPLLEPFPVDEDDRVRARPPTARTLEVPAFGSSPTPATDPYEWLLRQVGSGHSDTQRRRSRSVRSWQPVAALRTWPVET